MAEILHQLGGLLLGSVPTMLLFLLIVACYRFLVYRPLTQVLSERRERTEGAIEAAADAVAAAEAKAQEYEARLIAVRTDVFVARRQRLEEWNRERASAVAEVRETARKKILDAQASLADEEVAARRAIESAAEQLAAEVLRAVLPPELAATGSGR